MEKILNFRDLGGTPLRNGWLRTGVFFRSAHLDDASDADVRELNGYGIRAIFDFRDKSEWKKDANVYPKLSAEYKSLPVEIDSARLVQIRKERKLKTVEKSDLCEVYEKLPFGNTSYQEFFRYIKEKRVPILVHCSAGKDRTGVLSALLLKLFGAEDEVILSDYLKTKKDVGEIEKMFLSRLPFVARGLVKKRMAPVFLADEQYIRTSLRAVEQRYPDWESYFKQEYGISYEDVKEYVDTP